MIGAIKEPDGHVQEDRQKVVDIVELAEQQHLWLISILIVLSRMLIQARNVCFEHFRIS